MLLLRLKGRWTSSVQNTARPQSYLFTVQCCHSDSKADGPANVQITTRPQSYLFTVWCCYWDSKADGLPFNTVRAQSDLFTVQCCHSDSKADGPPSQHCQSTEWSLHCSMLSLRLKGRWTPPSQHSWSTEWSLHCLMCYWDSKADGSPWSKLSENRVIPSLFNVVIQTQRQKDPLCANHNQSTEWSLPCSMLFIETPKAGGLTQSTLSENRVISSLFYVVIQIQRQMNHP